MKWTKEDCCKWIESLHEEGFDMIKEHDQYRFVSPMAKGTITIYPEDIVELAIVDKEDKTTFYLHFHIEDKEHDQDLIQQMLVSLHNTARKRILKVVLCCTSGLTTSFFAQQLTQAADILHEDFTFSAVSFSDLYKAGFDCDIILLAPQIHFQYKKVKEVFHEQIVIRIPPDIFATYDAGRMLTLLQKEYHQHIDEAISEENIPLRSLYDNPYRILTIAVINHRQQTRFGYRIYDHGNKTLDKEVIKPNITLQDLFDLLDYVLTRHHNIDAIGISIPGVANHGTLNLEDSDFQHYNLATAIINRYHHPTIILNDVNAMALGYHAMHEDSDDMAFCFMPHGRIDIGAGIIIDGKLRLGYAHHAGEMHHLLKAYCPDLNHDDITPDTDLKMLSISCLCLISTLAPDKIVYYCELCPNPEEVRTALSKYIEPSYIPEIIHVNRLKRYQLPGTMIRCLEVLQSGTIRWNT
ncbi:MAG: ROK family protein [Lactimicrobium sp.]|jgi:cellobiose-specific phosphotransferase system component IIB|uniref:ROK family protein n=1 Tax=Lactimicrobium sp. TaxID=2563780 RepID=UPI002F35C60E